MLQKLGKELGEEKVHHHKFRRTLVTKAIDKGMPIEQVQHILGHTKIFPYIKVRNNLIFFSDITVNINYRKVWYNV